MDVAERIRELILSNYEAGGREYICPGPPHYTNPSLWDSCFHAEICAELCRIFEDSFFVDLAKNEISQFLKLQRKDGFIPHTIYHSQIRSLQRALFRPCTQPPVIAQALEAIGDAEWIRGVLPSVLNFYLYFQKYRDPDKDGLVSIHHSYESGRDTSPELDFFKGWPSRPLGFLNFVLRFRPVDTEELIFNCLWIKGLRVLVRFCQDLETQRALSKMADQAEDAIFELCWDENSQIFYPLDSENRKIKIVTIASLYPLVLEKIPGNMSDALVEHLTDPREFWTEYPIPSLPQNSPYFNCNRQYYRCCNWRGPVWINTSRHVVEGLMRHGYWDPALKIAKANCEMVEREGFWEFYHPSTGKGLRIEDFTWSAQVILYTRILGGNLTSSLNNKCPPTEDPTGILPTKDVA